jgi:hypothetical protein
MKDVKLSVTDHQSKKLEAMSGHARISARLYVRVDAHGEGGFELPVVVSNPQFDKAREVVGQFGSGKGSPHRGIMKHMLIKLGLCAYVADWGTYAPGTLLSSMGRAFLASSIEQGRFRFDAPLTNTKAVECALGHVKNSSQNAPSLPLLLLQRATEGLRRQIAPSHQG